MIIKILFLIICSVNSLYIENSYEQEKFPEFVSRNEVDGSECLSGNVTGLCIDYRKCPTFEYNLKNGVPSPICGWEGQNPLICCDSCKIFTNEYAREKEAFELEKRKQTILTGVKHIDYCRQWYRNLVYQCKPHIHMVYSIDKTYNADGNCFNPGYGMASPVGSQDALYGEFPHMALLGYGSTLDSAQWMCGGSIISSEYILTAGHCSTHRVMGPVRYVGVGMLKRTDPLFLWQRMEVDRFISHPEYKPPSKYNDIALIKTKTKITFYMETPLPACLTTKDLDRPDVDAFATGWGDLGFHNGTADTLQKVQVYRFTDDECSTMYPTNRNLMQGVNSSTQMCYGDREVARDTCGGDSGGPLQVHDKEMNCIWSIIGVTSYGRTCGLPGGAGIYTRVQPYVPWIESIVWP